MSDFVWSRVHWPNPTPSAQAIELLRRLAAEHDRPPLMLEAIGVAGMVTYRIGTEAQVAGSARHLIRSLLPGTVFEADTGRPDAPTALRLHARKPQLGFQTNAEELARGLLTALAATGEDEALILQLVIGRGFPPQVMLPRPLDPAQSLASELFLGPRRAPSETAAAMRKRMSEPSLEVSIRVAAAADSAYRTRDLLRGLTSALHAAEGTGSRFYFTGADARRFDEPPGNCRVQLTPRELTGLLGLPLDAEAMPGIGAAHPKLLRLDPARSERSRPFGISTAPGEQRPIGLGIEDACQHLIVTGPTGAGKSNLLLHLMQADVNAGRGIVLIDPKTDLVMDLLSRVPKARWDDVVVLDPSHEMPVGVNPFNIPGRSPELIADAILSVIRDLFPSMFGPRTSDVLHSALLTLASNPGATIDQLPRLLTEPGFRARLLPTIRDPHLRGFWQQFDALSETAQAQWAGPVLSRLRQFLLRPQLRRVLGQSEPRFSLRDVFTKNKILLVPLNTGIIGNEAAALLGSLIVSSLWGLALGRAAVPEARRHPVSIYIDEAQEFLRLGGELPDALARSRSLRVGWHLAHQFREQFSPEVRAAIDANARSKVAFGVEVADARALAAMAPELEPDDFMALERYEFYSRLVMKGRPGSWVSGRTLPPPPERADPKQLLRLSQRNYGALEPEPEYENFAAGSAEPDLATIGRRKRRE